MKYIDLNKGFFAIVDDKDYKNLKIFKWSVFKGQKALDYCAVTYVWDKKKKRSLCVSMHRMIMKAKKGQIVDHANCNPLDNRRENLRFATSEQSNANIRISKRNKSGYKGVFWHAGQKRYRVVIRLNGRQLHVGQFKDPIDAYCAYCVAAKLIYGEFARFE